jgi:hypothetical protein
LSLLLPATATVAVAAAAAAAPVSIAANHCRCLCLHNQCCLYLQVGRLQRRTVMGRQVRHGCWSRWEVSILDDFYLTDNLLNVFSSFLWYLRFGKVHAATKSRRYKKNAKDAI